MSTPGVVAVALPPMLDYHPDPSTWADMPTVRPEAEGT
jgi:hypothetical protein